MKLLAAIDSFKGSASCIELNQAALQGWGRRNKQSINLSQMVAKELLK